jgi:hypothetical protein
MSARILARNLFNTSLPAIIVYFSIMFIGGCLAGAEKKQATVASSAAISPGIPMDGYNIKQMDIVSTLLPKIIRIHVKDDADVQANQR